MPRSAQFTDVQSFLFLTHIPFVSALGAIVMNRFGSPVLALIGIVFIAGVPLLIAYRTIPSVHHPYAIYCTAVAIVLHTSLITSHLWGWDIHYELYVARLVAQSGFWDPAMEVATAPLVTVTLLANIFSEVTGLGLVWVYKLVYPLIFGLMPVGLYQLTRQEFGDGWTAALSPFVVIFFYGFFKAIPSKQAIAELFVVLLLVVALKNRRSVPVRGTLTSLFILSLIYSHYGISLLFFGFALATVAGVYIVHRGWLEDPLATIPLSRPEFPAFIAVMWVGWFLYTAEGLTVKRVFTVLLITISDILTVSDTATRSGVGYATRSFGAPLWAVYKGIYIVLIGFVGIGLLAGGYTLLKRRVLTHTTAYLLFSGTVFAFLCSSLIVTFGMGFDRTLMLSLVIVSPFALTGVRQGTMFATRLIRSNIISQGAIIRGFGVFLAIMVMFSSGAVFVVLGEAAPEYSIGVDKDAGWPVYSNDEVATTRWLENQGLTRQSADYDIGVFSRSPPINGRDGLLVSEVMYRGDITGIKPGSATVENTTYLYLSQQPVSKNGSYIDPHRTRFYRQAIQPRATRSYDSGHASVYSIAAGNYTR